MIRTRFAPSPTGEMHIGNLRTALYSWLWAKKNNGQFILRIEDTDRSRYNEDACCNILRLLNDFTIIPEKVYVQSERLSIYQYVAHMLVSQGKAYVCNCDKDAESMCECANTDPAWYSTYIPTKSYCIKLRVSPYGSYSNYEIVCHDELRGDIKYLSETLYDIVLLKQDGFPTYHLASVVDDSVMQITDVFRGDEWLGSFPYHVLLYAALNLKMPRFYHLPLICNESGKKLSKRDGDFSVMHLIDQGHIPSSIINYIALLGWHPSDNNEFYTIDDLLTAFDVSDLSASPAKFDYKKLRNVTLKHLKTSPGIEEFCNLQYNIDKYANRLTPLLPLIQDGINVDALLLQMEYSSTHFNINLNDVPFFKILYNVFKDCNNFVHYGDDTYLSTSAIQLVMKNLRDALYSNKQIHELIRLAITSTIIGLPAERLLSILSVNDGINLFKRYACIEL